MHKFLYYVWLSLFGLICIPLDAKVVFVNANAPEGGDGALWGTAFRNLQDALEVVSNGDEIWVTDLKRNNMDTRLIKQNLWKTNCCT